MLIDSDLQESRMSHEIHRLGRIAKGLRGNLRVIIYVAYFDVPRKVTMNPLIPMLYCAEHPKASITMPPFQLVP